MKYQDVFETYQSAYNIKVIVSTIIYLDSSCTITARNTKVESSEKIKNKLESRRIM
jgi:hypothetical protein